VSKVPDLREVERSICVAWELGGRTREEGGEVGKVTMNEYRCSSWPSQFVLSDPVHQTAAG